MRPQWCWFWWNHNPKIVQKCQSPTWGSIVAPQSLPLPYKHKLCTHLSSSCPTIVSSSFPSTERCKELLSHPTSANHLFPNTQIPLDFHLFHECFQVNSFTYQFYKALTLATNISSLSCPSNVCNSAVPFLQWCACWWLTSVLPGSLSNLLHPARSLRRPTPP